MLERLFGTTVRTLLARILTLLLLCLACTQRCGAGEAELGQWVLVTPPLFRQALEPLIEHRRGEGFKVVVIETTNCLNAEQLRQGDGTPLLAQLGQLWQQSPGQDYLLLAGALAINGKAQNEETLVPALRGVVERMKGKPSDHGYSLPAADGVPRVAVGRFPAHSVEEISAMVKKTLRLEQGTEPAAWRNRLVLMLGNPGGGVFAEMLVQQTLASRLTILHPTWSVARLVDMTSSPFAPPASQRLDTVRRYLEEGELFSVYLGHSDAAGLWSGNGYLMRRDAWAGLRIQDGQGVLFTCGCFSCQWSGGNGEGYGLAAMRNPAGPAAVIGASGESYSGPGQLAAEGLLACLSKPPFPSRLADYWLAVQAGLARGPMDQATFVLLDKFDGTGGKVPLAVQRLEHLEMWLLLGDPALRMPVVPVEIELKAAEPVTPGEAITVNGTLPERLGGTRIRVSLERPLTSAPPALEKLPPDLPDNRAERAHIAAQNFERANNHVLSRAETTAAGTRFSCSLQAPASMPWSNILVRAYAASDKSAALGAMSLRVAVAAPAPNK
jgi:hypothetical protein